MEITQKLSRAFDLLQEMTITSTRKNCETVAFVLEALQEAYKEIKEHGKGESNGEN